MAEWKFLLQKDGDRSWLPLDSPDVDILEGRYRIVAQTGQPNVDINIRICHLATQETPPKRRIQKRANRTNQNGLMVVTPFTNLQPGLWEFSCFLTDPMSDLLGDTLHHAVRLQVSPCSSEVTEEDWYAPPTAEEATPNGAELEAEPEAAIAPPPAEPSVTSPTPEPSLPTPVAASASSAPAMPSVEVAQALGISMDRLVEMTDLLSHQLVEEIFREFNFGTEVDSSAAEAQPEAEIAAPETQPLAASSPMAPPEDTAIAGGVPVLLTDLQLALAQSSWLAKRGETLVMAGQIRQKPELEETENAERPFVFDQATAHSLNGISQVQIVLRDPQTSEVLFSDRQSLADGPLPLDFRFEYVLPDELTTHLMLGEVVLQHTPATSDEASLSFDSSAFTITVNPELLVEEFQKINAVLADSAEIEELPEQVAQFSARLFKDKAKPKLDMAFLNMTTAPGVKVEVAPGQLATATLPKRAIAAEPKILPPQLYQPDPEQASKRRLDLPTFHFPATPISSPEEPIQKPETAVSPASIFELSEADFDEMTVLDELLPVTDPIAEPDPPPTGGGDNDAANHEPPETAAIAVTEPPSEPEMVEPDGAEQEDPDLFLALSADLQPDSQLPPPPPPNADLVPSSPAEEPELFEGLSPLIRTAFQSLRIQDRFLDRLNSLAADTELTTLLKLMQPQAVEQPVSTAESAIAASTPIISEPDPETLAMDEVVVLEDDPVWQEWIRRAGSRAKRVEPESHGPIENPLILPEEQPVPVPRLEVLTAEIIAGQTIRVRVKLPNLRPKIYVKLWVNDRQTRTILDGPRWLVDFLPDGFGELEANTQLTAPLGSLEVRLEAIAVEMQTQRESQKVSVDLVVAPPDIPDDLFDGFDLDF